MDVFAAGIGDHGGRVVLGWKRLAGLNKDGIFVAVTSPGEERG